MEDLSLLGIVQHIGALKPQAAKCYARNRHPYVREVKTLIDGVWVVISTCKCGTERRAWRDRRGKLHAVYTYPPGYRREPGSGHRTQAMNAAGWDLFVDMLKEVVE